MKFGKKHEAVHKAFSELHPEFDPVEIYETMCRLVKLGEEAIERGVGRLFREGKIKPKEKRKKSKKSKSEPGGDFG